MPREKSRYRDRRSSSRSSESSYERKKSKSKHRRRSRSRDRSESSSHRRKRSSSRSRHKRRSYSRSVSRDRYESRKRRSTSRSRGKRSRKSMSRDSRSRSSSRGRTKHSKSKKSSRRRSRSSSSRSSSFDIERPLPSRLVNLDDTETKLEKAIKAAEAAGLTMTKIPTYEYKEVEVKEDMPTIHDRNLLEELNSESFTQKAFVSSRNKKQNQNIVIDLNSQTVTVPETEIKVQRDDSIIDFNEIPSEEELKEMWIKKMYQYRKKMLRGDL
ncbi:serine/Arginine-related protein 53 [Ostrinia furnacalis]|uniref:serine/Arginine-related protein 53 n=1 Tax=Ostrinia furnacalis TaxID=93504 RepID=UPI00103C9BF9|nr:serine/Arginine-related protein 53 [Ostrinia furnacalis]